MKSIPLRKKFLTSQTAALTLYNASAGSGKTHTLVEEYLKITLRSEDPYAFRRILAITFTNKAANEMKSRILHALHTFSQQGMRRGSGDLPPLFTAVQSESDICADRLISRAQRVLTALVHDYSNFHIRTIDGFNHRVIRSFAKDLDIPGNFEVELDTDRLVSAISDRVLRRIGQDDFITAALIRFSEQKLGEAKSWQLRRDLKTVVQTLFEEKSYQVLQRLAAKEKADFIALRDRLVRQSTAFKTEMEKLGGDALELIARAGIAPCEWAGGRNGIAKYFSYLKDFRIGKLIPTPSVQKNVARDRWRSARAGPDFTVRFGPIKDGLLRLYDKAQKRLERGYPSLLKNRLILNNFAVFSLIHSFQSTLEAIEEEESILPIAQFNTAISRVVRESPTPFIYERLGERFQYFFIDEFQDTAAMQFDNLLPLLEEALSKPDGRVALMGDPKQSIYRWRGANPEGMLELADQKKPYPIRVEPLDYNYRSRQAIVDFNNRFFRFAGGKLRLPECRACYANVAQKTEKAGGYVEIRLSKHYANRIFEPAQLLEIKEIILDLRQRGFALSDICIPLRFKREISALADFLMQNDIRVATAESLLLQNNPQIRLLHCLLQIVQQPDDPLPKAALLEHLQAADSVGEIDLYPTQKILSQSTLSELQSWLEAHGIELDFHELSQENLLQRVFGLLHSLRLPQHHAFINSFLDEVFEFTKSHPQRESEFLHYWEANKEKWRVASEGDSNAVQITTIHQAKGLEFPAVICPVFSNPKSFQIHEDRDWFPLEPESYNGFDSFYSPYSSELKAVYPDRYAHYQNQVAFDNLNLLYVSFTRAAEALYILTCDENRYSAAYIVGFLEHTGDFTRGKSRYVFGEKVQKEKAAGEREAANGVAYLSDYVRSPWAQKLHIGGRGFQTDREGSRDALKRGRILHELMRSIHRAADVKAAVERAVKSGLLDASEGAAYEKKVSEVVEHPLLAPYFSAAFYSLNERDILMKDDSDLRPDRILLGADNQAVILDYKTGQPQESHRDQLATYAAVLTEAGLVVSRSLLVYTSGKITVEVVR
ncbi:MAG: UvrD-helicase domain-containing protein [Flavobacteriales bacterium]